MANTLRIAVASDIHYASDLERARGSDYEQRAIANPVLRMFVRHYRRTFWARDPLNRNHLLEAFFRRTDSSRAIVCGDLTCDTGFVGASDPAAFASAAECLSRLRQRFRDGVDVIHGDHDVGKMSFFGRRGGMRLESLRRMRDELSCPELWFRTVGEYWLVGIASSLVAYPAFCSEAPEEERAEWERLHKLHLRETGALFSKLPPRAKVLLFCHDPTALPALLGVDDVARRLGQIEHTFIGHLHSKLILRKSRLLAGMPHVTFLGHTVSKLSGALRKARLWRPFNVVLCPALAGIELLHDGGFYEVEIDLDGQSPARLDLKGLE